MITLHRKTRDISPEDRDFLFSITRAAFSQRRKTLVNSLSSLFAGKLTKEELQAAVAACGFDPLVRGERLSLRDYLTLSSYIKTIL